MKKLFSFFLLSAFAVLLLSCRDNNTEYVGDGNTYGVAFDITPSFSRVTSNTYEYNTPFNNALPESDVILVYMQVNTTNNNSPIWRLLPYTYFIGNANKDEVDYIFDFSKFDISLYVNSTSTFNLDNNSQFYTGKKFRVVQVPASSGKTDYSNYDEVIKKYNIDESKIKTL